LYKKVSGRDVGLERTASLQLDIMDSPQGLSPTGWTDVIADTRGVELSSDRESGSRGGSRGSSSSSSSSEMSVYSEDLFDGIASPREIDLEWGVLGETIDREWIDLNEIIVEVHDFRYELENSINSLGYMFSVNTILGAAGVGSMIYRKLSHIRDGGQLFDLLHSPYIFFCGIVWCVIQLIYLKTVRDVSNCREGIQMRLRTPFYTQLYLAHSGGGDIKAVANNTLTTIDWLVLREILSDNWCEFKVLGLSLSDVEGVKQSFMFGSFLIAGIEVLRL